MDPNNIIIQQPQPAQPIESDMERLDRYQREAAAKTSQKEAPAERSARTAYESAKAYHEQVNRPYTGNKYTYEQKRAAAIDLKEKEQAYYASSNQAAKERRLQTHADEKKARDETRAAQEAAQLAENEGRLREAMRARYPGSDANFLKDWPELKRQHYRKSTLAAMDRPRVTPF